MDRMENRAAKRYLGRVKRALICGRADRQALLTRCGTLVEDFRQENPEAGYSEFAAAFGEPAAFAEELLSSLGEEKVEAARKRRFFVRLGVAVLLLIVLISSTAFWYTKYKESIILDENINVYEGSVFDVTPEGYDSFTGIPSSVWWDTKN